MKFENLYSTTAERAREQAEGVIESAKSGARKASDWADAGKKPVKKVADAGLKLSSISHRTTDKLLRKQAQVLEGEFDAISDYFDDVADAGDFRSLARVQLELLPQLARRAIGNGRDAAGIVAEAGSDVRSLFAKTVTDLRGSKAKARKTVKKAAKTARKTAKKAKSTAKKAA